jgi:hypothetical protein
MGNGEPEASSQEVRLGRAAGAPLEHCILKWIDVIVLIYIVRLCWGLVCGMNVYVRCREHVQANLCTLGDSRP